MSIDTKATHQNQLAPEANKFHQGNGDDGRHYWLTPPALYEKLAAEFRFDFDPCPYPKPADFDGLTCDWGQSSYVNPPFGSTVHEGKKKGPTAWARKAIAEQQKGNRVVLVYPIDKWVLMLLAAGAEVRNLGDVKWLATEDGSTGKGTGRHIACFILEPKPAGSLPAGGVSDRYEAIKEMAYLLKMAPRDEVVAVEILQALGAQYDAAMLASRAAPQPAQEPLTDEALEQLDSLDGQIGYFLGRLRSLPTPEMGSLIAGNIRERLGKVRTLLAGIKPKD